MSLKAMAILAVIVLAVIVCAVVAALTLNKGPGAAGDTAMTGSLLDTVQVAKPNSPTDPIVGLFSSVDCPDAKNFTFSYKTNATGNPNAVTFNESATITDIRDMTTVVRYYVWKGSWQANWATMPAASNGCISLAYMITLSQGVDSGGPQVKTLVLKIYADRKEFTMDGIIYNAGPAKDYSNVLAGIVATLQRAKPNTTADPLFGIFSSVESPDAKNFTFVLKPGYNNPATFNETVTIKYLDQTTRKEFHVMGGYWQARWSTIAINPNVNYIGLPYFIYLDGTDDPISQGPLVLKIYADHREFTYNNVVYRPGQGADYGEVLSGIMATLQGASPNTASDPITGKFVNDNSLRNFTFSYNPRASVPNQATHDEIQTILSRNSTGIAASRTEYSTWGGSWQADWDSIVLNPNVNYISLPYMLTLDQLRDGSGGKAPVTLKIYADHREFTYGSVVYKNVQPLNLLKLPTISLR
jgi:hypothetical protein